MAVARDLTSSEAALVLELDEASQTLSVLAASPGLEAVQSAVRKALDQGAAGRCLREGVPIVISQTMPGANVPGPDAAPVSPPERSVLAVPLMVSSKPLGALLAVNRDGSDYTGEERALLEILAMPIALVLENAELRRQMESTTKEFSDLDRLKTDFIAITSHELRTPLGLILGHATFLRELLGPQYHEQLDVIIKNASRLKDIIESLSSMDNFKTGGARLRLQTFALRDLVADVMDSYAETAVQRKIELKTLPGPLELMVEADRTKIAIALGNLVRNALAFTDSGGHVQIRYESLEGFAKVSVVDDGVGIPARDLARVFDRFFQVESHLTRHHTGMGLGLSVAKAMIEMHGGRIWVESTEGKGSDFSFLIPCKPGEPTAAKTAPRPA